MGLTMLSPWPRFVGSSTYAWRRWGQLQEIAEYRNPTWFRDSSKEN